VCGDSGAVHDAFKTLPYHTVLPSRASDLVSSSEISRVEPSHRGSRRGRGLDANELLVDVTRDGGSSLPNLLRRPTHAPLPSALTQNQVKLLLIESWSGSADVEESRLLIGYDNVRTLHGLALVFLQPRHSNPSWQDARDELGWP